MNNKYIDHNLIELILLCIELPSAILITFTSGIAAVCIAMFLIWIIILPIFNPILAKYIEGKYFDG